MDRNPPADAGDTSWIPGLGRSLVLQSNCAPQLLRLRSRAWELRLLNPPVLQLLKPARPTEGSHLNEKPQDGN